MYEDDQKHPSGAKGKDAIPDTHDHASIFATTRIPGMGETVYVPGDGFLVSNNGFAKHARTSIYASKKQELAGPPKGHFANDTGMYFSEEEILSMAAAIQTHRRMTGAKSKKERAFEEARARKHKGYDAYDSSKSGVFSASDDYDVDRSRSTISIGLSFIGPPGLPLNGSKIMHRTAVSIDIVNPDGRLICKVMMSPEQFASALFSNKHTPCTLARYWSLSDDDVLLTERVRPPQSIAKRMEARLKHRLQYHEDLLRKLAEEIEAQAATGKPARKKQLADFAKQVRLSISNSAADSAFTVAQAREEITGIMESAALQFLGQSALDNETLLEAAGPALTMEEEEVIDLEGGE